MSFASWLGIESVKDRQQKMHERLDRIEAGAKHIIEEHQAPLVEPEFYRRRVMPLYREPLYIATTEDKGNVRQSANSLAACIDYCKEQEALKQARIPL